LKKQVCVRWREVIDEDKRLWKALLLRDFNWRKQGGRGKGSAKRHKKIQNYQQHYVVLHRNRTVPNNTTRTTHARTTRHAQHSRHTRVWQTAARDAGLKKRARMEKVARILRVVRAVPPLGGGQRRAHAVRAVCVRARSLNIAHAQPHTRARAI
jgi:hypothetical protein